MKNNRDRLMKSVAFLATTALVLVVATAAWFVSSTKLDSDDFQGDVDLGLFSVAYFESIDEDRNGEIDAPAVWTPASGPNLDIDSLVPGETHFYRLDVTTYENPIDLELIFSGIDAVARSGSAATKSDMFNRIIMNFTTDDGLGSPIPGTSARNSDLLTLLTGPDETEFTVYTMDLSAHTDSTVSIYYSVGMAGEHSSADDDIQGSSVSVGLIDFSATYH